MADQARARARPCQPGVELPLFPAMKPVRAGHQARTVTHERARPRTSANDGALARLLTVRQVCDRLQCGRTYVYKLLEQRVLRAVKLGRLTRVPLSEVEDFIARRVAAAEDAAAGRQIPSSGVALGPP